VTISPARVDDRGGSQRDYYRSTNEELVEEALRKLAIDQYVGFFDKPTFRSGVAFTIYQVREELKKHGHTPFLSGDRARPKSSRSPSLRSGENSGKGELLAVAPHLPGFDRSLAGPAQKRSNR